MEPPPPNSPSRNPIKTAEKYPKYSKANYDFRFLLPESQGETFLFSNSIKLLVNRQSRILSLEFQNLSPYQIWSIP